MPAKTFMQIFMWPIVLGVLTMIGLVMTLLLETGWFELVSISALALPVIVMIYTYYFRDVIRH
ncbi:MAG: hypothetical protein B7X95_02980 [Methylophilaceae bacterium 17-44-8]|jgi:hypothetical protein|nr:MAG: hypothetical protein B7Y48_01170 [Methylophilales bacterium 28-44-11]OYZ11870.1 MAG: hypothetical protein B7Y32_00175 [Methylophilales bacterium 16-45-7]OZA06345.1 MAG: hypothetical protein B7X95_02980 [Methylophilaceae bacterium 17-44-8]